MGAAPRIAACLTLPGTEKILDTSCRLSLQPPSEFACRPGKSPKIEKDKHTL
jgi:hypothetical protein